MAKVHARGPFNAAKIDASDNGLTAKHPSRLRHCLRRIRQYGVDTDLVGAVLNARADVLDCTDTPAESQWNAAFHRDPLDEVEQRKYRFMPIILSMMLEGHFAAADVEHDQLVNIPINHSFNVQNRVTNILMFLKFLATDHPAVEQIQYRN